MRWVCLALVLAALAGCATAEEPTKKEGSQRFEVALIGDFPYAAGQEAQAQTMFDELNGEDLAFILHDGDIKSGSTPCADEVFYTELNRLESSINPLVYTPGDNEWTDCHRTGYDPNERLQLLREVFFTGEESLGERTIALTRQGEDYPENARWSYGGVTFATLHLVGSNNGLNPDNDPDEYAARNEANLAWLRDFRRGRLGR